MSMVPEASSPPPGGKGPRWQLALLVGVLVLLGVAARARNYLSSPSYWYDEASLLENVFSRGPRELLRPLSEDQAAPPLYLFLLRALYVGMGPAEWVMRLPAFAAGLAALALMGPLARRLVGPDAWPWAVGLAAVSHHAVTHGCEAKPYLLDVLVAEIILLSGLLAMPAGGARRGRGCTAAVLLTGLLAPWVSYPGVFLLGGVSAALFLFAWRAKRREDYLLGTAFTTIVCCSTVALWFLAAHHQRSAYLEHFWTHAFPDLSSWKGLVEPFLLLRRIGDYATSSMGVPLMLLSLLGFLLLMRQSLERLALLSVPLVLALIAGAMHRYPLEDRLLFFAAPCVWLGAAIGLGFLARVWAAHGRWGQAGVLLLAMVLVPEGIRMAYCVAVLPESTPFREAFAYVHAHWQEGDRLWVSNPQVYEVYHGRPPELFERTTPREEVVETVRQGRLWVVFTVLNPPAPYEPTLFAGLRKSGSPCLLRHAGKRLEIHLFGRAPVPYPPGATTATLDRGE